MSLIATNEHIMFVFNAYGVRVRRKYHLVGNVFVWTLNCNIVIVVITIIAVETWRNSLLSM